MKKLKNVKTVKATTVFDVKNPEQPKLIGLFAFPDEAKEHALTCAAIRWARHKEKGGNEPFESFEKTFVTGSSFGVYDSDIVIYREAQKAAEGQRQAQPRSFGRRSKYLLRKAYYAVAA